MQKHVLLKHACKNASCVIDIETDEIICNKCGIILGHYTEHKKDQKHLMRPKAGIRFSDMGLSGKITSKRYDYSGKKIPPHLHAKHKKLVTLDSRTKSGPTSKRNLGAGLVLIQTMSDKLALNEAAAEKAAHVFRKAHNLGLSRGRGIRELAAASIYVSCRINRIPRNLTEIAKLSNIRRTTLSKMYRVLHSVMEIKTDPYAPETFVSKFANKLAINEKTKRKAIHVLCEAKKHNLLAGRRPSSLAASSLYVASKHYGLKIGFREFASVSKNSVNTLRKLVKELEGLIVL